MKRLFVLINILFIATLAYGKSSIELVESIPVETTLDNQDIRNTADVWLDMINSAKKSLDFGEFYISHNEGDTLSSVLNAIFAAADRGVTVRFVVDGNMYKTYPETVDALSHYPGIEVHVYHLTNITDGVMHAKYFIVDGREVFLGSQNMDWRSLEHIHELGVRINDKQTAKFYCDIFDLDWSLSADNADTEAIMQNLDNQYDYVSHMINDPAYGKMTLIPTASNPDIMYRIKNWDEVWLVKMINYAQTNIKIQLLSYAPLSHGELFSVMDLALRRAAARGVRIEMILADWNFYSPRIDYIKSLQAIPNIDIKFSTIPQASEGYIGYARVEHCKYMVVDDSSCWIGTANWSKSYFHNGRNLGLVIKNAPLSLRVSQIFDKSWNSSYCHLVDLGKTYQRKEIGE